MDFLDKHIATSTTISGAQNLEDIGSRVLTGSGTN